MTGAYFINNSCFNSNSTSAVFELVTGGTCTCFFSNNIIYAINSTGVAFVRVTDTFTFAGNEYSGNGDWIYAGTTYTTYATWQAATGQEKIGGVNVGLNSNAMLLNPGGAGTIGGYIPASTPQYLLASTSSPVFQAGINPATQYSIGVATADFYGATVPDGSGKYSMGASQGACTAPCIAAGLDQINSSTGLAFSNGNLTITAATPNTSNDAPTTTTASSGLCYGEFIFVAGRTGSHESMAFGVANGTYNFTTPGSGFGADANSFGLYQDGMFFINNGAGVQLLPTIAAFGDVIGVAINFTTKNVWFRDGTGNWNNSGTANPATAVGGQSFSALNAGPYFAAIEADNTTTTADKVSINIGGSSFVNGPPVGV